MTPRFPLTNNPGDCFWPGSASHVGGNVPEADSRAFGRYARGASVASSAKGATCSTAFSFEANMTNNIEKTRGV